MADKASLKVALIKKGLRLLSQIRWLKLLRLKVALIKKGLRHKGFTPYSGCFCLKVALIKKGLRHGKIYQHFKRALFESSPD